MRDCGDRVFLKIIGWKPVIFGANEGFKEKPGSARNLPQKKYLPDRSVPRPLAGAAGLSARQCRETLPITTISAVRQSMLKALITAIPAAPQGNSGRNPHWFENATMPRVWFRQIRRFADSRSTSREGFHSSSLRRVDKQPHMGPNDRVETEISLIRKASQREQHLPKMPFG